MSEEIRALLVIILVIAICIAGAMVFYVLLINPLIEESRERCKNLSIQRNASSFIARNFRDCELTFCEEVHSGNDTLLGKCYTEEWEREARK